MKTDEQWKWLSKILDSIECYIWDEDELVIDPATVVNAQAAIQTKVESMIVEARMEQLATFQTRLMAVAISKKRLAQLELLSDIISKELSALQSSKGEK